MNIFTIIALWVALTGNMSDTARYENCEDIRAKVEAFNDMGADLVVWDDDCSVEWVD